jgi:putative ABC transport system permease protein
MTQWQIAVSSLKFYLRTNFAIALGVAAATAVLTGALIVGDSMRNSLQELTLERLGKIDEILVSDGFFRQKLAEEVRQTAGFRNAYSSVTPVIMFPGGTVRYQSGDLARRAGQVTVLGIENEFWSFDNSNSDQPADMQTESVIINQALADDLQIDASDVAAGQARITVRIPKQNQLPADSALGRKTDLIESIVDLKIAQVIPTQGLGRFGMHPTQSDPLNVYLPIERLQDSLRRTVLKHKSDPAQANVLMFSSSSETPPTARTTNSLRSSIRPTLEDYGLTLKRVTQKYGQGTEAKTIFDYWSLSSETMVLTDEAVNSISSEFPDATPVFTYLANDMRKPSQESGIPFSMIAAVDFGDSFNPVSAASNKPIRKLAENEIVLNQWAAEDLGIQAGGKVVVTFFDPETTFHPRFVAFRPIIEDFLL